MPMLLRVTAAVSSDRGTRSGTRAAKAGINMAAPQPSPKVKASSTQGVVAPLRVVMPRPAAMLIIQMIPVIIYRRRSTMSARAPAGIARKNTGKTMAVWTSDTMKGSAVRLVISQPAPTSCIQVPRLDTRLAIQIARNMGRRRGAPADGSTAASAGSSRELCEATIRAS